jgi:hypothetical protein
MTEKPKSKESEFYATEFRGDATLHINSYLSSIHDRSEFDDRAIYYFGIVACACKFESVMSEYVESWCRHSLPATNNTLRRISIMLADDVSRTTGTETWKKWFRVLFNVDLPKESGGSWDDIVILFKLRNQLAHGRSTYFKSIYQRDGRYVGGSADDSAYKHALEHLISKNVIEMNKVVGLSIDCLLTREVVCYFKNSVSSALECLAKHPALVGVNKLDGAQPGPPLEIDAAATGHPLDIVEIMPSQNIGLID